MPTDIIYCLVYLSTKKDKLIASGELECYVPASSADDAREKLRTYFYPHNVSVTFPDVESSEPEDHLYRYTDADGIEHIQGSGAILS